MPWQSRDRETKRKADAKYDAAYRRNRKLAMERCRWRCEIRLDGCQGTASQCDHIVPVSSGGTNDLSNLRGACSSCHAKTTAQQGGGYRRGGRRADPEPLQHRTDWSKW